MYCTEIFLTCRASLMLQVSICWLTIETKYWTRSPACQTSKIDEFSPNPQYLCSPYTVYTSYNQLVICEQHSSQIFYLKS